ncbi:hypothetical protein GGR51DRAFT_563458 [Nemania sp. FL0031]|nr:hypothetical protein GGR51DRAFT_563458 [Nemania sp. FL0031]
MAAAVTKIEKNGGHLKRNMPFPSRDDLVLDEMIPLSSCGNRLLQGYESKDVETLKDIRINGIDKTLNEYDLDAIIRPMDERIPTISAAAGYPVGTMSLGYSASPGRTFGMCIVAGAGQEGKILQAMSA